MLDPKPITNVTISHTQTNDLRMMWQPEDHVTTDDLVVFARACEVAGFGGSTISFAFEEDKHGRRRVVGFRVARERNLPV